MNFHVQSEAWLEGMKTRRRNPIRGSSLSTYQSYLNKWIVPALGNYDLAEFHNGAMKGFINHLAEAKLAPKSITEIVAVVKLIVASAVNDNGDPLYPRSWNAEFIDLPIVERAKQKTPSLSVATLEGAIKAAPPDLATLYALLAGTGLRIGEALATRIGPQEGLTAWDPANACLSVRTQLLPTNREGPPKTLAGIRDVDICERLNQVLIAHVGTRTEGFLFTGRRGGPVWRGAIRERGLEAQSLPGFHAFRRFRVTRLREYGVPEDIVKWWIGHASTDITEKYSKLNQNRELRREWVERVGLGFKIKKEISNEYSGSF